jgi:ABC-2 type transport system permease protein
MGSSLSYITALALFNVRSSLAPLLLAAASAIMMFGNNLIFFLVWVIYFANFSSLKGWVLDDLALLIGVVAWAFGLTVFLAGGVRDLAQTIVDGGLDLHLGRPRHPLPGLLMSRSLPSGLGDMASALVFWLSFGHSGIGNLPALLAVSSAAAVVFGATLTITQCIVFWFPGALSLCEHLFNMLLMVAYYPQHPYGFLVRLALFTVFPTAFISLVPAEAVRDHSIVEGLALLAAAILYAGLATLVFERGLRRYGSGNRVLELR